MPRRRSPRQEAIDEIVASLEIDYKHLQFKVASFKTRLKGLHEEQAKLKRKRAELHKTINALKFNRGPDLEE